VAVFGASGYTGRFIVGELVRRGWRPILCGRGGERLSAVARLHPDLEVRVASLAEPGSIELAFHGVTAVINAAGPFATTSAPIIEAAVRARVPYAGVAAEPDVVADAFHRHHRAARAAGVPVAPACGFYGGLGDLLATAAMGDWVEADEVCLAFALSSWRPTAGTRATIAAASARRGGQRLVFREGALQLTDGPAPVGSWDFPAPFGRQAVAQEFTTADAVTMARHLRWRHLGECMTLAALDDLAGPELDARSDATGPSDQRFLVEAVVRRGSLERRRVASGQDIYARSAPLVVEAMQRLVALGESRAGVLALGELGDAEGFLL
jgi:hypothetical protein